ncbi:AAA family ATPase [Wohlfahrtiimonas chitiniclastica]|uniref:ATP-binding protein n=1 Tax=Wohlfahrtiimonas chitiniclastica TaxID=400946 RepID=UPI000B99B7BE|nr:ATP-binding protein [Wohlfahrtiimonas chitiniclastica]MBS7836492.1 ATP-binding protein [Wohlfahrtiimonas chitiniclastica]MBS7838344.1 ATP-binding protein [Wohlfahrtiimonas chitiniclastica]OYQ71262.1 AAA family ATPase [Wohlfahrtiimonas chitiniclastica]OYQ82888.1 AAA family ATPase [Wohlfahrtiimonas chitiniclastica]OYQ85079.1 AAA family ATPase [Wohlfahrtiimonas chitiniclastica]
MSNQSLLNERLLSLIALIEPLIPKVPLSVDFSECAAFRWVRADQWMPAHLQPIPRFAAIDYQNLVGVEDKIECLRQNTLQFLHGLPANNVLLTGARGTGKSSLIKATLTEFADQGLKMVEIDRDALDDLQKLLTLLSESNERFIIFCDDLSFEANDAAYKSLKALLDGSLMNPPENILFYATSNRRHLLPEYMKDNEQAQHDHNGEVHLGDAIEEKISLSERFGLWLTFYSFSQKDYLNVVKNWLTTLDPDCHFTPDAEREALQFALLRGSRSGRVAMQFAKSFSGAHQLKNMNKE